MDVNEIKEFMDLPQEQRCMTMFTVLNNHVSSVKETKWLVRILLAAVAALATVGKLF